MTTKQIAEAVGKPERTVKGWATKAGAKLASAGAKLASAGHGKAADWDLDEACLIIEIGLGKNAAALYRENARKGADGDRLDRIESMILDLTKAVAGLIPALAVAKAPQQALPAPAPMAQRDDLRRIMARAGRISGDYRGPWVELYTQLYYRLHRNLKECAANRGIDTLDYIEAEGLMPQVVSIALDIFGRDE